MAKQIIFSGSYTRNSIGCEFYYCFFFHIVSMQRFIADFQYIYFTIVSIHYFQLTTFLIDRKYIEKKINSITDTFPADVSYCDSKQRLSLLITLVL